MVRSAASLVLGVGLASVYVLPAWYEQRWVEITRVIDPGMRVEDSFLFAHTGEPYHDHVLHSASSIAIALLGVGLLALCLVFLVRARQAHHPGPGDLASWTLPAKLAVVLAAILFLQSPWSDPLWRLAPELRFLQFPWRWLLVGGLAAMLACALLAERLLRPMGKVWLWVAAGVLCAGAWSAGHVAANAYAQSCDDEDNVAAQRALLFAPTSDDPVSAATDVEGFEGTDEYTPSGADNGEVQQGLPAVRLLAHADEDEGDDTATPNPDWKPAAGMPGEIRITDWLAEHRRFTVRVKTPGYAVLRLMDYPGWQVRVNGQVVSARTHRDDGLLTLPVAAGVTAVDVRYRATGDVLAGRAVSAVSACLLGLLAGLGFRRSGAGKRTRPAGRLTIVSLPVMMTKMQPDVHAILSTGLALTEEALDRLLPPAAAIPTSIHQAMRHSTFAGGKRLRPILVMEAARMVLGDGNLPRGIADLGAAIEMLHTYSLVHDDLPALDNDDLRRGKPTCHVVYGEAIAILAGDALQTHAYQVLASLDCPAEARVEIIRLVAEATGTVEGMIGGQVLDLEGEHTRPTPESVDAIHRAKTGALIRVSVVAGGVYAGAGREEVVALTAFGRKAGLAFQIIDDILDMTEDSSQLGKTAGKDQASDKATWPAVHGIEASRAHAAAMVDEAFAALAPWGEKADGLKAVARYLVERKH